MSEPVRPHDVSAPREPVDPKPATMRRVVEALARLVERRRGELPPREDVDRG